MLSSILKKKKQHNLSSTDQERNFLKNGSMLLEDLIGFSNGRYNIPIRRFSVEELSRATNRFCSDQVVSRVGGYVPIYMGYFEERLIFIKYDGHSSSGYKSRAICEAIRDIVVTALMSGHKNVFKLIGCCLDSKIPASVYECAGSTIETLANRLYQTGGGGGGMVEMNESLTWKSRLKIADDIAYAVVYMHTAFPTPIINRYLTPSNIMIDQFGVAKLIDFSLSMLLPPGETQVQEVRIAGKYGYMAPEYCLEGFVATKTDVYAFGMILLELLIGKRAVDIQHENKHASPNESENEYTDKDHSSPNESVNEYADGFRPIPYVKEYVDKDQFNELVDPRILEGGGGGIEQEQQLHAVVALALRCTQTNREDRPEMINVAKELRRIIKSVSPSLPQP